MPRPRQLDPVRLDANNKLRRLAWTLVWSLLYRPSPILLHGWRRFLLRLFGADIGNGAYPYPRARIWAPWNLRMAEHSCLANDVDCYCVAPVSLGAHATVSQYSFLCTASHDYRNPAMPLVAAPIVIEAEAWVAADVFVGPGVTVRIGAVVGARSTLLTDAPPWTVLAGSPAQARGTRPQFSRRGAGAEDMGPEQAGPHRTAAPGGWNKL
jgi:putative colanic acid biosynthesis acetyltransferase WcaF